MYSRLFEEMEKQNISGYELAKRAKINKSDWYNAKNGHRPFYPAWRERIAEVLKVPAAVLFQED